jgi:hypothetical protein
LIGKIVATISKLRLFQAIHNNNPISEADLNLSAPGDAGFTYDRLLSELPDWLDGEGLTSDEVTFLTDLAQLTDEDISHIDALGYHEFATLLNETVDSSIVPINLSTESETSSLTLRLDLLNDLKNTNLQIAIPNLSNLGEENIFTEPTTQSNFPTIPGGNVLVTPNVDGAELGPVIRDNPSVQTGGDISANPLTPFNLTAQDFANWVLEAKAQGGTTDYPKQDPNWDWIWLILLWWLMQLLNLLRTLPWDEIRPRRRDDEHKPVYRNGSYNARNLTPRLVDVPGGLSMTITLPIDRAAMIRGGKPLLVELGFEIEPDSTPQDPGHFLLRPGASQRSRGLSLEAWAATRDTLNNDDPTTWYELTAILMGIAELYRP